MTTSTDGGPNVAWIIEKSLRHRLEQHNRVNPEAIGDIIAFAQKALSVRMGRQGWHVTEADIQRVLSEIERRPGWQTATQYEGRAANLPRERETAMQRLKRANCENAGLKRNDDNTYSPAD